MEIELPRVTVVITCYNLGKYLRDAVDSIRNQTFDEWEMVVVDDGSNEPETLQILEGLEREGIRLLRLSNGGVARARNTAIRSSSAPYICCLDADDILAPEYLERTIAAMDRDRFQRVAIVTTWMKAFGDANELVMNGGTKEPSRLLTDNLFHVSSLFRRELWEASGGYSESLPGYQDWDLWISFIERGYLWETIEEPLFHYRIRPGSMVTNSDRIRPQLLGSIVERHRAFFERNVVSAIVHREEKMRALIDELKGHWASGRRKQKIREGFADLNPPIFPGEEIYLFGTGQMASEVVGILSDLKARVIGVFDNDKSRQGSYFYNARVDTPALQERRVVIASMWGQEISQQLLKLGYEEENIVWPANPEACSKKVNDAELRNVSNGEISVPKRDRATVVPAQINRVEVRDLCNRPVSLSIGEGSYVDPEVVVDAVERIHIGKNTTIRKGVVLRPEGGEIFIGDNCVINHYTVFHGKGGIYLGDWTIVAPQCGFYAQNHHFDSFELPITLQANSGRGIFLMGDNWIGSHSVICDDVTLGKGTVVGANSTVTGSLPMAVVAAGSPARIMKDRFSDTWDFHQRERAVEDGMPPEITEHVRERGRLLAGLISPEDIVLDLGCGEGMITAMIGEIAVNTIGCDYCHSAVERAGSRYPEIRFLQSNVTRLGFEEGTFTKVVFSDVAEHLLPAQFRRSLREIVRVLRKDGALLLSTPITGKGGQTSTYAHIYEYSEAEMESLLGSVFHKVKLLSHGFGLFVAASKK